MKKIIIPIVVIAILFCTVRIQAQNAQVSPVSGLNQQNTSVMNNNIQILQSGVNGIYTVIQTYFANNILGTQYGGTGQNSSSWASGDTIIMAQQGVWSHAPGKWIPNNIQVFTTTGTWTKPAGVSSVYVEVIGGGGSGGVGANSVNLGAGGGGGGGGYAEGVIGVTGNVTVTIGSTNSFAGSATIQATSGSTGESGQTTRGGRGGAGGVGSGGTINANGGPGTIGGFSGANGIGGNGGNSAIGGGGIGGLTTVFAGGNGTAYGGGGGGGGATNNANGGSGDQGAVIVYY